MNTWDYIDGNKSRKFVGKASMWSWSPIGARKSNLKILFRAPQSDTDWKAIRGLFGGQKLH
jgi:hypothetical protein